MPGTSRAKLAKAVARKRLSKLGESGVAKSAKGKKAGPSGFFPDQPVGTSRQEEGPSTEGRGGRPRTHRTGVPKPPRTGGPHIP